MDKVIIDGVDVSGCVCFATAQGVATVNGILVKDIDNACTVKQKPCEDIKNCMFKKQYKQLQRLQAKYDDLHLTYAGCKTANAGLQELNNELKKENMHYKHLIAKIRTIAKTGIEGFCPECSLRYCEENNCYETAIIDIYDLLKKEDEDKNE